jgi:hypothetical protein
MVNAVLGIWIMVSPAVLGFAGTSAAPAYRIIGPLIVSFAVVAWWEETRPVGRANLLTGLALIVVPFVMEFGMVALVNSLVVGVAVAALSQVWGTYRPETFGGGWSALWNTERLEKYSTSTETDTQSPGRY